MAKINVQTKMTQVLLTLSWALCSSFLFATNSDTLHFNWLGDSISNQYFEKSVMIIPVQILNDTNEYYFQFDTGANKSSVYTGNENGTKTIISLSNSNTLLTNLGAIELDTLSYMSPFKQDNKLIIGTIGCDVLREKCIQIDFIQQTIIVSTELATTKFNRKPMKMSYGRPVIEVQLSGSTVNFLFDTGSSIFDLWTTKKIWRKTSMKNYSPIKLSIWSWGQINSIYTSPLPYGPNLFDCRNINLNSISYSSNKNYEKTFHQAGVDGIIGNKPFLSNVILLDFRNKQIGILNCE